MASMIVVGGTMTGENGGAEPSARLREVILARYGTYRAFAAAMDPPMDPTQLAAALRPGRRPAPETLDRWSGALDWEPTRLRRWWGYVVDQPPPALPAPGDSEEARVAFVESWPDPAFHDRLMAQKEVRTPAAYRRLALRLFAMWRANMRGLLETAEDETGEAWADDGEGPDAP